MKLARLINGPFKKLAAAGLVAVAIALPVTNLTEAASMVNMSATTTVANATKNAGTYNWTGSTSAAYNEVVAVQVVYNNDEAADSGITANGLHVKINIPTTPGASQTITTSVAADNINTISGSASVNLGRSDAYLQYIPGTATWKHATTNYADINGNVNVATEKVSDDVVLGSTGVNLGTANPCQAGSIVVQARVMVPGVTIDKYVSENGKWVTTNTADPSETLNYEIAYQNTGNTTQNHVVIRDNLPPSMTYVAGSTKLYDASHPSGLAMPDYLTQKGIDAGNFTPGSNAYVTFKVTLPAASALACGETEFRNVGVVQPEGMNEYYNTAVTTVNKTCANAAYSCDAFGLTVDGVSRKVTVNKFEYTAKDGATFNHVVVDWGDKSQALTTNNVIGQTHTFQAAGSYTVTATVHFTAGGKDVTSVCSQPVSFGTTGTPKPGTPGQLVNTGAGDVVALFFGVAAASAIAYNVVLRRQAR